MINVDEKILQAMKNKNSIELRTCRALKTELSKFLTAKGAKPLDENSFIGIVKKMISQREDAVKQYNDAGRLELALGESDEIEVLKTFIPKEATAEDIEAWLEFNNYHCISKKEMGTVIKLVKEALPTADGKMIAKIVKDLVTE